MATMQQRRGGGLRGRRRKPAGAPWEGGQGETPPDEKWTFLNLITEWAETAKWLFGSREAWGKEGAERERLHGH